MRRLYENYAHDQRQKQRGAWLGLVFAVFTLLAFVFAHVWREIPFGKLPQTGPWIYLVVYGGWVSLGLAWMCVRIRHSAARWAELRRRRKALRKKYEG